MAALIAAHIICTTLEYGALIASNTALAIVAGKRDLRTFGAASESALLCARIFGC